MIKNTRPKTNVSVWCFAVLIISYFFLSGMMKMNTSELMHSMNG